MQAFSTFGTDAVIQNIMDAHQDIPFHLFSTGHELLLYYEGAYPEVFNGGQTYEVKGHVGPIPAKGFIVIQHFSILEDHYTIFEKHAKRDIEPIQQMNGFLASRILQRTHERGYVIMTIWKDASAYQNGLTSKKLTENLISSTKSYQPIINHTFTKYYHIIEEEK